MVAVARHGQAARAVEGRVRLGVEAGAGLVRVLGQGVVGPVGEGVVGVSAKVRNTFVRLLDQEGRPPVAGEMDAPLSTSCTLASSGAETTSWPASEPVRI